MTLDRPKGFQRFFFFSLSLLVLTQGTNTLNFQIFRSDWEKKTLNCPSEFLYYTKSLQENFNAYHLLRHSNLGDLRGAFFGEIVKLVYLLQTKQ